ncbi:pentapeptide repeat-containing protein [Dongia sp.]|uniref:pentapeptide repeat-containing protein n=1 Tax=Dongia sp. TaxID=1977262 RepID=UPI003751D3E7
MAKQERIFAAVLLAFFGLLGSDAALACTCSTSDLTETDAERYFRYTDLAVDAKVVGLRTDVVCAPNDNDILPCVNLDAVVLSVTNIYKGSSEESVEVAYDDDCEPKFVVGSTRQIVAQWMIPTDGSRPYYRTNSCLLDLTEDARYRDHLDSYGNDWRRLIARTAQAPQDIGAWQDLAAFLERWEDYPSALEAYRRVAALQPAAGATAVGRMLFYQRDARAKASLEQAVALRPEDAQARGLLALLYARDAVPPTERFPTPGPFDFRSVNLRGFQFTELDLRGADFRGTELHLAKFESTDLSEANFRGADLEWVSWRKVSLAGADLRDTRLYALEYVRNAKLAGARIGIGSLSSPEAPPISDLDLTGVHIRCGSAPNPRGRDWFDGDWAGYMESILLAQQIRKTQPSADLGPACRKAIANYLEPTPETATCTPWIDEENRPPECEIAWDE